MSKTAWIILCVIILAIVALEFTTASDGTDDESSDGGSGSSGLSALQEALAGFENVDPSHNNPGGVTIGGVVQTYPTIEAGLAAQASAISNVIRLIGGEGATLAQFIAKYSGQSGQILQNYVATVSAKLGVTPSTPIGDIVSNSSSDDPSTDDGDDDDDYSD